MKVVIVGNFSERARGLIGRTFPRDWVVVLTTPHEAAKELEGADVLIPEHMSVDRALLDRAKNLKLIQTGAGYDNVNIDECTKRGVLVAHAKGVNAAAVAEHVFAFILTWVKNVILLDRMMKQGAYDVDYVGSELSGKTMGIVGLGRIGQEVGRLAHAFRMKVFACHTRRINVPADIELADLPTLLQHSDIVTLHVSLQQQTRHMIGRKELALMKRNALLINTSRGPVVDEKALIDALQKGQIAGAALDVFETEPLPADSLLRKMPNVILTPHTAGMPDGLKFHQKRYEFFVGNITRIGAGKPPVNALNEVSRGAVSWSDQ